jgi:hypothetical protein
MQNQEIIEKIKKYLPCYHANDGRPHQRIVILEKNEFERKIKKYINLNTNNIEIIVDGFSELHYKKCSLMSSEAETLFNRFQHDKEVMPQIERIIAEEKIIQEDIKGRLLEAYKALQKEYNKPWFKKVKTDEIKQTFENTLSNSLKTLKNGVLIVEGTEHNAQCEKYTKVVMDMLFHTERKTSLVALKTLIATLGVVGLLSSLAVAIETFVGTTALLAPIAPAVTAITEGLTFLVAANPVLFPIALGIIALISCLAITYSITKESKKLTADDIVVEHNMLDDCLYQDFEKRMKDIAENLKASLVHYKQSGCNTSLNKWEESLQNRIHDNENKSIEIS